MSRDLLALGVDGDAFVLYKHQTSQSLPQCLGPTSNNHHRTSTDRVLIVATMDMIDVMAMNTIDAMLWLI